MGGGEGLGVAWLDAHADFDTPEDSLSGFTDVMGLAILTGSGWRALRGTIPGCGVVGEDHVVLAGTRALEPHQRERVARSWLQVVPAAFTTDALGTAVDTLRERVGRVYLHVDLDVLDTYRLRPSSRRPRHHRGRRPHDRPPDRHSRLGSTLTGQGLRHGDWCPTPPIPQSDPSPEQSRP